MSTKKISHVCARICVLGLLLIGISFLPEGEVFAQEQVSYLYSNNNPSGPNSIGRFRIEADGALTRLGNTATGGNSSSPAPSGGTRIVVTGNFLYATNALSRSLSGFTINPANGDLTSAFTPMVFPALVFPAGQSPQLFLRATPDGRFLYLMLETTVECLSINQTNGQLTSVGTFVPVIGDRLTGLTVSRNGSLLAVSSANSRQIAVAKIDSSTGLLTQATGSPYSPVGISQFGLFPAGMDFNGAGDRLFVGSTLSNLNVVRVDATNGAILGEITGSPFSNSSLSTQTGVLVSSNGQFLYTFSGLFSQIASFTIAADGTPTPIAGSPTSLPVSFIGSDALVLNPTGKTIYSVNRFAGNINANTISGGLVGGPVLNSPYSTGAGTGVGWLAIYSPSPVAGPRNVNDQVTFSVTSQGLSGITGGCATLGYSNRYSIDADLRNIGTNTFTSPYFQVLSLRQKNGSISPNPFRLGTADDFNASLCTGGLVGTTQAIPGPIVPTQVVPANFEIEMPVLSRFEFTVDLFATIGGPVPSRIESTPTDNRKGRARVSRIGNLKVEVTGFDKAGNPLLTATFIPEKGMEGQFKVAGVRATAAK